MEGFPPLADPDQEQDTPEPSAKVAELLDVIDAADISLDELLELTLCNIQEMADAYETAALAENIDLDTVAWTSTALTRLQIAATVLVELAPDNDDEDLEEALEAA